MLQQRTTQVFLISEMYFSLLQFRSIWMHSNTSPQYIGVHHNSLSLTDSYLASIRPFQVNTLFPITRPHGLLGPHQFLHYFAFYSLFDGFPEFFDSKLFYTMIKRVNIWFSQLQFSKIFIFYLHNYVNE